MTWKRFYFSNPPFSHYLTNATKSQRLPQPLETQNKSPNLLFFAFLVILFLENQKFEIRIAVGGDEEKTGVEVEVWKDGQASDFRLLEGDNLRLVYEASKYATGIIARLYLEQLHEEGQLDEQYKKLHSK